MAERSGLHGVIRGLRSELLQAARFLRANDLSAIFAYLKRRDTPSKVQFLKYAAVGASATILHNVVFYLLARTLLPALDQTMDPALRARNFMLSNTVGFLVTVVYGYILNASWIFTPGRHHRLVEFGLFFAASGFSFFAGNALAQWLIKEHNLPSSIAQGSLIVTSILVNFLVRKFVVFQR